MSVWGYFNLDEICFEFSGGNSEQQNYLKSFYQSLQDTSYNKQKIKIEMTSQIIDTHTSDSLIPVLDEQYYIGEDQSTFIQYSPKKWIIVTSGNNYINVTTFNDWKLTKDILNQALRDAIYRVCVMKNMSVAHSACVVCPWGTVLLFGASGVGKSTLAIALGNFGYDIITDDKCVITENRTMTSLGFPITFRAGTSNLIPKLKKYETNVPNIVFTNNTLRYRYKIAINYNELVGKDRRYTQQSDYYIVFLKRSDKENAKWIYKNESEYKTLLSEYNEEIKSLNPIRLLSNAKNVYEFLLPHSINLEYRSTLDVFRAGPRG